MASISPERALEACKVCPALASAAEPDARQVAVGPRVSPQVAEGRASPRAAAARAERLAAGEAPVLRQEVVPAAPMATEVARASPRPGPVPALPPGPEGWPASRPRAVVWALRSKPEG